MKLSYFEQITDIAGMYGVSTILSGLYRKKNAG